MTSDVIGLIVMCICIVLFLVRAIPTVVTGVLGCLLMVLTGAASFEQVFSGFSDSIVILMFCAMAVGVAMFKTGAAQVLGRTVITWAHGDERVFLITCCVIGGVLSMFLANTAILASMIPIIDSVCKTSAHMKRRNLMLPIACSVMLGGACTLIGCTPQLTANALMQKMSGVEMGMWSLTAPGVAIFACFLIYLVFLGYRDGNRIWGERPEWTMGVEEEKIESVLQPHHDRRRLTIMFIIVALMVISYIAAVLPLAVTAMCAALLCILTGCCTIDDIAREVNWETVLFLGSCLGLGNALTVSGTGDLMGEGVSVLLGNVTSPYLIFVAMVTFTLFLSQFITNSTAIIIVLPIALALCERYGFSPMAFCVGITLAASLACCTPLAAAQIAMTQVAGYEFTDYIRYCWKPTLLFLAGILLFVPLFFPLA